MMNDRWMTYIREARDRTEMYARLAEWLRAVLPL